MTYTKNVVDSALRTSVFTDFFTNTKDYAHEYVKINDRQYGTIITDVNGHKRYVRIGVIVAEEREDMSAEELMASEMTKYNEAQEKKAEKKRKSEEKAKHDQEQREKKAQEKAKKEDNANQ